MRVEESASFLNPQGWWYSLPYNIQFLTLSFEGVLQFPALHWVTLNSPQQQHRIYFVMESLPPTTAFEKVQFPSRSSTKTVQDKNRVSGWEEEGSLVYTPCLQREDYMLRSMSNVYCYCVVLILHTFSRHTQMQLCWNEKAPFSN